MYQLSTDELMFWDRNTDVLPLYHAFAQKLFACFPDTSMRVQKTQITYAHRHVYACVSYANIKPKAELPAACFLLTLGLPYPLESRRVALKSEPYPGRWTTHILIDSETALDAELFSWIRQAYDFSLRKARRGQGR